ncbi:MAG: N-acetylmuramoyl-L-alanine amidase protein [Sphingomonas bacterium]|nr:N-acetylmuramoyl-L-alanine amidase protein [Sphingomonas bacterium]
MMPRCRRRGAGWRLATERGRNPSTHTETREQAMPYALTWLPEVLHAAGLKVAEQPGWTTRGRRDVGPIRGVMCHHTANRHPGNMPSLALITEGRAGLPGPLAQLGLGRDGTYYVIAAGLANHAGRGMWQGVSSGNTSFIGIEAEHQGTAAVPWPDVQLDAYRRGVAAILDRIGAPAAMCCGHKEYRLPAGYKVDPTFEMAPFRRSVQAIQAGAGAVRATIPIADAAARPTLRRGARGEAVKIVQARIGAAADGIFGAGTEAAVRAFQRIKGDPVRDAADGIVGPRTWAWIDAP